MNASDGIHVAVRERHDSRLGAAQDLGREREVGDAVRGLVPERDLPERVLRRIDDVVADDP